TKTIKVDVRVIAATNQNLQDLITQGKFRKDLYYRLNIINIEIPPLRERKEDIPLLVEEFIKKHITHTRKKIEKISEVALRLLMNYHWPGNVRELENVIERAIILSKGSVIQPEDLPEFINNSIISNSVPLNNNGLQLREALKEPEREVILKALNSVNWKRNEAARILGINRTTLYKKMVKFGLNKNNHNDNKTTDQQY
ncbi:MAG: sigma 54-interacting transcriptional regulator, partial [Candidatus Omnitrophica bacterium]|nr:sigma 54-interacting transcriptional regulator [Candidatus Omnitrophota bacterium]